MSAIKEAQAHGNLTEFTVSELSSAIKRTVEDAFGLVRLRGEISGYRGPHSSGHAYLTLKDDRAKIDAVIWRGTFSQLKFKPEEGLEVVVIGRLTTFPGKSSYQIIIEQLEPAGAGALMALLEERKKKFTAEGLFDEERKKPLPFWPQVIGIVTSPTGAVIRDMMHGFMERCPARVLVWPVRVQGETCGAEVASAIHGFNSIGSDGLFPRPDLLIVARGGGSLEDLWGFNEEAVVRAAAASDIPLISAVGHETDWTLLDLVADARAPTPTKAAEWAVPKHIDLTTRVCDCAARVQRCVQRHIQKLRVEFRGLERSFPKPSTLLAVPRQRMDGATLRLGHSLRQFSQQARSRFERQDAKLTPRLVLLRSQQAEQRLAACRNQLQSLFGQNIRQRRLRFSASADRLSSILLKLPILHKRERLKHLDQRFVQGSTLAARTHRSHLDGALHRLNALFQHNIHKARFRYTDRSDRLNISVVARLAFQRRERLQEMGQRFLQAGAVCLSKSRIKLEGCEQLLRSLSHKSVLERGFALVRDRNGKMIQRAQALVGQRSSLDIEFADGVVAVYSQDRTSEMPVQARYTAAAVKRSVPIKKDDGGQGSLL